MAEKSVLFGEIYRLIYYSNGSSRKRISQKLDLSLPTVTNYLHQLMEERLIFIDGTQDSTGGRKANSYKIVPSAAYSIGVNITRNHLNIVLVDLDENIIDSVRIRIVFRDEDKYFKQIGEFIDNILQRNKISQERFLGVGISMPALIADDQKEITYAKVINISPTAYSRITRCIHYPILLFNDANCAGLAEWWKTRQSEPAVYLSLNPSIGGATISSSTIQTGVNNRASEFGHVTIVPNGRKCYCGRKGCVDAYCAETVLTAFTDGNLDTFFRELPHNQGFQNVFDSYQSYLSLIINSLRMCYDCDVILGGNVGAHLEQYIDNLKQKAVVLNPFEASAEYIKPCQYKTSASAVGAALYLIKDYIDNM